MNNNLVRSYRVVIVRVGTTYNLLILFFSRTFNFQNQLIDSLLPFLLSGTIPYLGFKMPIRLCSVFRSNIFSCLLLQLLLLLCLSYFFSSTLYLFPDRTNMFIEEFMLKSCLDGYHVFNLIVNIKE